MTGARRKTMPAKVAAAHERLVLCRLVIGIMRTLHEHYAPIGEPFGKRLETMFIGMTLLLGQIEHKPFSVAKLAAYMNMPRTTVIHRLGRLQKWGLLHREGPHYYVDPGALNSIMGLASYRQVRAILKKANGELCILDTKTLL
jgi:biotin operon repressor